MADNVTVVDEAAGVEVATDERTIGGITVHVQRAYEMGGTSIATGQEDVTTTSAEKVAARDTRKYVTIVNHGTDDFWIGPSGVSITTGLKIPPGASATIYTTAAVHADAEATLTDAFHYVEVFS
jgi:hypothetical protein